MAGEGDIGRVVDARAGRRESKAAKYSAIGVERRVKHYPLSSSEMVGLSVANPVASALIGWGVNLACTWATTEDPKAARLVGMTAIGALSFGGIIMVITWGFFLMVLYQSRRDKG